MSCPLLCIAAYKALLCSLISVTNSRDSTTSGEAKPGLSRTCWANSEVKNVALNTAVTRVFCHEDFCPKGTGFYDMR